MAFDWKEAVGKAAPLLGGLLFGPAGTAAATIVASALGVENTEDAIAAAMENDPDAAVKLAEIESRERITLQRMTAEAETSRLAEVNKTMRVELQSKDPFVRRMRPMFGYAIIFSIIIEMLMGVWIILFGGAGPDGAQIGMADFVAMVEAFAIPQSVALGVLGVYFKQRSNEKAWSAGYEPKGLLGSLLK